MLTCICNLASVWKMELKGQYLSGLILIITIISMSDASRLSRVSNSTIIKSIKSEDGDVIDCVDIFHQPAFDHPLLKNHTIKMTPSYHPEGLFAHNNLSNKSQVTQLWQLSGDCPEGTIPIRRTEKQKNSLTKKHRNIPSSAGPYAGDPYPHEHAFAQTGPGDFYGTKATISAWNPYVERPNEFSLSQIWVLRGSFGSDLNSIEAGWTVDPLIFGDSNTRLFVFWTRDSYLHTGCYNLRCPGFVQTSNQMAIGGSIATTGNNPEISLLVWKDASQQVWWLQYNGITVGYWPTAIFTTLTGSASLIQWGGEIINSNINGIHTATDMGSGNFAEAGFGKASYFRNLLVVDNANTLVPPPSITSFARYPSCYDISVGKSNNWGNFFYYGGPGRNPNCP